MKQHVILGIAAVLGAAGLANSASATITTTSDTTLASPNTSPATGSELPNGSFYNGTGNPQGGFEVSQDSTTGIELGLRAILSFGGPVTPSGNTYVVPTGVQTSGPRAGNATWNYEFSIDLAPNGVGGLTFATVGASVLMTITDLTTGATGSFNPLGIPDDAAYGVSDADGPTSGHHTGVLPTDWGAQNSESLSGLPGFSPWNGDTYQFTLSVTDGVTTDSDTIIVQAVPEPASLTLLGMGIAGLVGARRRR